jgi:hypothetical protein
VDEPKGQVTGSATDPQCDASWRFTELCQLLQHLGFEMRISGSHHFFRKAGTSEVINLQPRDGQAKNYQVRQARKVLEKNKLL